MAIHPWKYLSICLLIGLLGGLLHNNAWGQTPRVVQDTMAERTQACTACHGEQGRAGPDGYYPRLAGKPAGYLHQQLRNFAQGRRHYGLMARLVEPMSDAYMAEIAQYFAQLQLPYPPPSPSSLPAAQLERGKQLVLHGEPARGLPACVQCHGSRLTGVLPDVPGLLGLPVDYLNAQLGAWQTGQRKAQAPDCMAQVARRIAHEDVIAISHWLAGQTLPADTRPAPSPVLASAPSSASTPSPSSVLSDPLWRCAKAPAPHRPSTPPWPARSAAQQQP